MTLVEAAFWFCLACVVYTYFGYPLLLAAAATIASRPRKKGCFDGTVSFVVAAHNEERGIVRRLDELDKLVADSEVDGEVILVSDGSIDDTAALARKHESERVHVIELSEKSGKAGALTIGCQSATGDVLVFTDVRQRWAAGALGELLGNFADPTVGAVSGDLVIESSTGVLQGVSLYWRFEKWLRHTESRLDSTVGVTGAISAVRRELFRPIPAGIILDDVYWPLQVIMQGHRVVHEQAAHAFDRLPDRGRDEFRRKVRTLAGNYELVRRLPALLLPWRNRLWWQFVSHKLLRLVVPWALLGLLACSAFLPVPINLGAIALQGAGYALGIAGLWQPVSRRFRLAAAAGSFLVLNAAAWTAFWVWICGQSGRSWKKVVYEAPVTAAGKTQGDTAAKSAV